MIGFSCLRFQKFAREQQERKLTDGEQAFQDAHRERCPECQYYERTLMASSQLLRRSDPEDSIEEERISTARIARRVILVLRRDTFQYWFPGVLGAAAAGLAVLAAVQLASDSGRLPVFHPGNQDARLIRMRDGSLYPVVNPAINLDELRSP